MISTRYVRRFAIGVVTLTCFALMSAQPSFAQDAPPGPEAAPDVYKTLAENDQWRVIEGTWQPGQEDNFHSHPADRVSLIQTDCKLHISKPDGTFRVGEPKAGKVIVRTGKPVASHKAKNIGESVCVIRIVELK